MSAILQRSAGTPSLRMPIQSAKHRIVLMLTGFIASNTVFSNSKNEYLLGMLTRISLYRSPIIFNIIELAVEFQIEDSFMFGLKNNSFKH